jgi:hypothetical protein
MAKLDEAVSPETAMKLYTNLNGDMTQTTKVFTSYRVLILNYFLPGSCPKRLFLVPSPQTSGLRSFGLLQGQHLLYFGQISRIFNDVRTKVTVPYALTCTDNYLQHTIPHFVVVSIIANNII